MFSRAAMVMRDLLGLTEALELTEALDVLLMLEAPLRQADIYIEVFVTKLVINCVNFRKTFCIFTGGTSAC